MVMGEGELAYFGRSDDVETYLKLIGFPIPSTKVNPFDYLIDLVSQNSTREHSFSLDYEDRLKYLTTIIRIAADLRYAEAVAKDNESGEGKQKQSMLESHTSWDAINSFFGARSPKSQQSSTTSSTSAPKPNVLPYQLDHPPALSDVVKMHSRERIKKATSIHSYEYHYAPVTATTSKEQSLRFVKKKDLLSDPGVLSPERDKQKHSYYFSPYIPLKGGGSSEATSLLCEGLSEVIVSSKEEVEREEEGEKKDEVRGSALRNVIEGEVSRSRETSIEDGDRDKEENIGTEEEEETSLFSRCSPTRSQLKTMKREIKVQRKKEQQLRKVRNKHKFQYKNSFSKQFSVLLKRSMKAVIRDPSRGLFNFLEYTVLALIVGAMWFQLDFVQDDVGVRATVGFIISAFFLVVPAYGSSLMISDERDLVHREYSVGAYSTMAYYLSLWATLALIDFVKVVVYISITTTKLHGLALVSIVL
ncbi:hypothetical protein ADUPG1_012628 [Aduncisulcus paluster]|uniref:ABC-2 type transporter transmembrane domain-containing protein n=1 Tax=Aduncisulcus paluster TaxID=2918883 RepID=A0ABQ5K4X0_9EUKA|nr:hypothetical protein ADUPG1_012628 [Aduncisulcus paluster]